MSDYLHITVRWLDDRFHGLAGRGGPLEWPPSPYRLFQALVAGASRVGQIDALLASFRWLEAQVPPVIIAPLALPGRAITRFVPNNDGDKEPDRQDRLTGKTFRPTIMLAEPAVHYLWQCDPMEKPAAGIIAAAHCLICLGWGIDMAFAEARFITDEMITNIPGVRWSPKPGVFRGEGMLRVPKDQSLNDLLKAHQSALARIGSDGVLKSVQKPHVYDSVYYTSTVRPLGRPCQLFSLRDASGAFLPEPQAKLMHVAGMVRHAAIKAMDLKQNGYPPPGVADPEKWVGTAIAGHRNGNNDHQQFSYLPLPSIGHEHADCDIRRVMIVAPFDQESNLIHLARQLDGCQLEREGGGEAPILELFHGDGVTRQYTGGSATWATVTPIILPGHDDHKPAKTKKLLETALRQSGIEQPCEFTWSAMPNFRHCLAAFKHDRQGRHLGYFRPDHLEKFTLVHARLTFQSPIVGPIVIGAGRHCGFGLCAVVDGG